MSMIITFVPLIVGSLLPLFAVDIAGAQAPEQIFRHMFNTLQRNQQTIIPAAPSIQRPQTSTSKPTIDCANIRTPLGLILCSDERAAKADWDVNAAAWAFAASLDDDARKAFWDRHDAWVQSVFKSCRLTTPAVSDSQRGCVVNVYRARTNALKSKLSSDALAETNLSPQQRADI